jgi:predicted ATP-grasp superfamily ATP-dependent carboligase
MPLCARRAVGKAIVFAREDLMARYTHRWLLWRDVADVPRPQTFIRRGQPICTIFAEATTADECYAALRRRAERVYADVSTWAHED